MKKSLTSFKMSGNRIFVAEDPGARTPVGIVCARQGDLWVNPALCLIFVFCGCCWKAVNCQPRVQSQPPPCDAQLVWFDGSLRAGQLADTQAVIPPNSEVVFCGADGLSLGFLPGGGGSGLQPPGPCGSLGCDAQFLTIDQDSQTTACGSLQGPTPLPCFPSLIFCAQDGTLWLGDVAPSDTGSVPCTADLLFCNGTNVQQGPLIDTQAEIPPNSEILFCGANGLSLGFLPGASGLPAPGPCTVLSCESQFLTIDQDSQTTACGSLQGPTALPCLASLVFCADDGTLWLGDVAPADAIPCTSDLIFCNGTTVQQAPIIDNQTVNCEPTLLFCGASGISSGLVGDGPSLQCTDRFVVCDGTSWRQALVGDPAPLSCSDAFLVCDGEGWHQGTIGGTGATLSTADPILFCSNGTVQLGRLPSALAVHSGFMPEVGFIPGNHFLMDWITPTIFQPSPYLDASNGAWDNVTGRYTAQEPGIYEAILSGVATIQGGTGPMEFFVRINVDGLPFTTPMQPAAVVVVPGLTSSGTYFSASTLTDLVPGNQIRINVQILEPGVPDQTLLLHADLNIKRIQF